MTGGRPLASILADIEPHIAAELRDGETVLDYVMLRGDLGLIPDALVDEIRSGFAKQVEDEVTNQLLGSAELKEWRAQLW